MQVRHAPWHRGRRDIDFADRRTRHTELYTQLAGARKSWSASGALRPLRSFGLAVSTACARAVGFRSGLARHRGAYARSGSRTDGTIGTLGRRPYVRDRLVLVLHVGYAFVPLGFVILAGAILFPNSVPISAGYSCLDRGGHRNNDARHHDTRQFGHTGHALVAEPLTQAIYAAVVFAALLRMAAALVPDAVPLLHAAGVAWIAAFWAFAIGYGPLLLRPRFDARQ